LWWILGPCGVPGYPLFVFLASILGGLMCGVRSCVVFRLFATILLLLHVCVLLRGVSVPCFCCPLAIDVACLRILPLCLYGSGMFVVVGGCVSSNDNKISFKLYKLF